ncbi:MAG TPA: mechanosensitive ion channel domain-containing protein [Stenomitos sp.]
MKRPLWIIVGMGWAIGLALSLSWHSPFIEMAIADVPTGIPVQLAGKPLFWVHDKFRSSSPAQRAQRISKRIERLAENQSIPVEALGTSDAEGSTQIYAEDIVLISLSDTDAKAMQRSRQDLASDYLQRIKTAITNYREEHSSGYFARAIAIAAASTIVLAAFLMSLNNIVPTAYRWLDTQRNRRIPSLRIQAFEVLSSNQLSDLLLASLRIVRWSIVAGLLYVYSSFTLSLFPQTRQWGELLFSYIYQALGTAGYAFLAYLPNLVTLVLIGGGTYYIIRFLKLVFDGLGRQALSIRGFYPEWAEPTYRLLTYFAVALAFAIAFPYLPGAKSPAFQGVSIFLGALVSLGATGAVANIVAGIILIYTRAFRVGDRVKVGDIVGDIEEKLLLVTRIRTLYNVLVTIPNASLLSSHILNYSALLRDNQTPLIVSTTVTLGYDLPWQQVHRTLIDAALATPRILADPAPFVLQTALNDFYVSYELRAYTQDPAQMQLIGSDLHQNIQDHCNAVGMEICSPHFAAVRDGNQAAVPADSLPTDYTAPGFRLQPLSPPSWGWKQPPATPQSPNPPSSSDPFEGGKA